MRYKPHILFLINICNVTICSFFTDYWNSFWIFFSDAICFFFSFVYIYIQLINFVDIMSLNKKIIIIPNGCVFLNDMFKIVLKLFCFTQTRYSQIKWQSTENQLWRCVRKMRSWVWVFFFWSSSSSDWNIFEDSSDG